MDMHEQPRAVSAAGAEIGNVGDQAIGEFPPEIRERLKILRSEADEVKRCFTQFSFQAFAFSAVLLGLILRYLSEHPYVGMASLLVTFLLLLVTRVGNYKYTTANRNYGFELHVYRCLHYQPTCPDQSTRQMLALGWEEAMFAWRIVQATIFNRIYDRTTISHSYREKADVRALSYRWWNTDALRKGHGKHHPGSYLKYMQQFLHALALASMFPAVCTGAYYMRNNLDRPISPEFVFGSCCSIVVVIVALHVAVQIRRNNATRAILEIGLLSIQASAVVWRCAVVAHFRAIEETKSFRGYTEALSKKADELVEKIDEIHQWLEDDSRFPDKTFTGLKRLNGNAHSSIKG